MNRRFQAKLAKSKNVHIIKTTASIPTKCCTAIKTTKCPSRVVPTHASQIQNGRQTAAILEKMKNCHISVAMQAISKKLARRRSLILLIAPTVKNLKFQKSNMAVAAILKNRKIATSQLRFERFRWNLAQWRSSTFWLLRLLKFLNFKNPRWRCSNLEKSKNHYISATARLIVTKYGMVTQFDTHDEFHN